MSFEQEHVELSSQESIINPSQELAQKPLQDTCVNDRSELPEEPCDKLLQEMSQDVCDRPMFNLVPKPVHDPIEQLLQIAENKMSYETTKEHVEQQEFLWKPLQDPCQTCMELPNKVLQEPLPSVEQVATNTDLPQLFHKSLQTPSEPLSSTTHCQKSLQ